MRYYFIDESGDGVLFNARGEVVFEKTNQPKNFILGLLDIADPHALISDLNDLRARILADSYFAGIPSLKAENCKTALAFHAKDDLPEIRMEVYRLLIRHDLRFTAVVKSLRAVLTYVRQRNRVDPEYRYHPDELYDQMAHRLLRQRLHRNEEYQIIFARRGQSNRARMLTETIKRARNDYCQERGIRVGSRSTVYSAFSRERPELQATDYFLWALQRTFERDEDRFLRFIWPKVALVHDMDDTRERKQGRYYDTKRPLMLEDIKKRLRI